MRWLVQFHTFKRRNHGLAEPTIDAILEDYKVRQEPFLLNIPLFAGIPEALEQISKKHAIFIITSNLSSATRAVFNKHRLLCIEDVIGAEQEKSKVKKIERIRALYPDMPAFILGIRREIWLKAVRQAPTLLL